MISICLCAVSYFRKYVKDFAIVARPLTQLTKKEVMFNWDTEQQQAFACLKEILCTRPVLAIYHPKYDTELHTDASKHGVAGILLQKQPDSKLKPVLYFSRQTSKEEQRYHSYELETMAVVNSMQRFRVYLLGIPFKVVTDCNALRLTMTKRDIIPRIGRWWMVTQEFNFTIEYRPGSRMAHVDALSRNPIDDSSNCYEGVQILTINISESDWVLTAQLQDERCRYLNDVLLRAPADKEECLIHKEYELKHGRIYRKTSEGLKWVVPKSARHTVTNYFHDQAGHLAVDKTISQIQQHYWFPRLRKYVTRYIRCCLNCLYNKNSGGPQPGFLHCIQKEPTPMDTLHIDHLGPFVKSKQGNMYLIVSVDAFTKYVFMKAVKNTKSSPVIHFLKEIFNTFGVPRRIICDQGTAFTSKEFKKYATEIGVKVVYNATGTPRANGQVERYNRTVLSALAASTDEEDTWDQNIPRIRLGINSSTNKATNKSPHEMIFGYQLRGVNDAFLTSEVCVDGLVNLHENRQKAVEAIALNQEKQKCRFDAKRKNVKFKIDDLVLIQRKLTQK